MSSETNTSNSRSGRNKIPIRWSEYRLSELRQIAAGVAPVEHPIERKLSQAQLAAVEGAFDRAETSVLSVLQNERARCLMHDAALHAMLVALFVVQRLDIASQLVEERFKPGCTTILEIAEHGPGPGGIVWEVAEPASMRFMFDASLLQNDKTRVGVVWFAWIFPVFAAFARAWPGETGTTLFSNWDDAIGPGVAMCSNRPDCFLVPDNVFVPTRGHQHLRQEYAAAAVPWDQRQPVAFFRGSTTGHATDRSSGWRSLPRVRLCEIARDSGGLIDAGIVRVVQLNDANAEAELQAAGLMRSAVHRTEFQRYKYQIDIDGNTNAWPGLYEKLLSGSPVLKVASRYGFRQWYYDRLKPWINYVPVASDMSDLIDKVRWLQQHDDAARAIGAQGQALAMSLDYDAEINGAIRTLSAALRYSSRRPETEMHFGVGQADNVYLRDGWLEAEQAGVPMCDAESRIHVPRPIAQDDFRLGLDVSPTWVSSDHPKQRVAISVNGEVLLQGEVAQRETVTCRIGRERIQASPGLTITLLHPDGLTTASRERPLDGRIYSLMLHSLTLTPARAPRLGRSVRGDEGWLVLSNEVTVREGVVLRQMLTYHGTVVYVDEPDGELRHGQARKVPPNLFVVGDARAACLLHRSEDGAHRMSLLRRIGTTFVPEVATAVTDWHFEVVAAEIQGFGLRRDGLFLCAEDDGRVTLSRERLSLWERFAAIAASQATPMLAK